MTAKLLSNCIACGSQELELCLDLGSQPPANNLRLHTSDIELDFPLAVNRCTHCNHLQLTHIVDPKILYKNYLYVSGTSQTYMNYMEWYAKFVCETYTGIPNSILDIGCNDGSQLDYFKKLGTRTWGVDPAENLYPISSSKHQVTLGFWGADTATKVNEKFDVITSQNAFAHIPDPIEYLRLVHDRLHDDGLLFISTSQADMVLNGEFDTIYHEHISFYNSYSMKCLAERAGFYLVDVVKSHIHGVSYIFVLSKVKFNKHRIENILSLESYMGLQDPKTYHDWADRARCIINETVDAVDSYRAKGFKIVGYGAAAKGMTFIGASKINMVAIVDDNPFKVGKWPPGVNIPIVDIDYLSGLDEDEKILFIPLAWNFFTEIQKNILKRRNNPRDRFLRYFPKVEIR